MAIIILPRKPKTPTRTTGARRQNRRIENAIQKSIMDWFAWKGVRCERLNSGAMKAEERYVRFGFPGCPDLMILDPVVRVGFIEVKAPDGRLSKDQRDFQDHCRRSGIPHLVARSLEDVIAWWRSYETASAYTNLD